MRDLYAARAARAYAAMQRHFHMGSGRYRRDGRLRRPRADAHLWPYTRALVATLDFAGIEGDPVEGIDVEAELADRLHGLERYWDPDRRRAAYSSDIRGSRFGGDRYYDDNAWVGLALIQYERMRPGSGYLVRAEELFRFALAGWGEDQAPSPGGVFWVEQGRGAGTRNHDRNLVSTAPNAQLGLHLSELLGRHLADDRIGVRQMYEWILATLDASRGTSTPGTGLFWDKLTSDGTIDRAIWSYNQGSMVGLNVQLARAAEPGGSEHLALAEAIAHKALRHFAGRYELQPPAFNAIFFRNLLLLCDATGDAALRGAILDAMRGYADWAWGDRRDRRDCFQFASGGVTLLGQSAIVQVLALLAWDPQSYRRIG